MLPNIAVEEIFALKGGTAINLFVQDMPRLSVDIDLTYLPVKPRDDSLKEIGDGITRIKERVRKVVVGSKVSGPPKGCFLLSEAMFKLK